MRGALTPPAAAECAAGVAAGTAVPETPEPSDGLEHGGASRLTRVLKTRTAALSRHVLELERARASGQLRKARAALVQGGQELEALERARARARALTTQRLPDDELQMLLDANDRCNEHIKKWKRMVIAEPMAPAKDEVSAEEGTLLERVAAVRCAPAALLRGASAACSAQDAIARRPALRGTDTTRIARIAAVVADMRV